MRPILLPGLTAVLAAACASVFAQSPTPSAPTRADPVPAGHFALQINQVSVELAPTRGNRARGVLVVSPDNHGLRVAGELTGLANNSEHGFHIHAVGDCSAPDGASAGDHFNPDNASHGAPGSANHHAGDLPNARSNGQGTARVEARIDGLTLGDGGSTDVLGKAIVVHANADDYRSQPAGNAGPRIACGVIARAPATPVPASPAAATPTS